MYCSLADARAELNAKDTVDDDKLLRYVRQASARIDLIMSPRVRKAVFEPIVEERAFVLTSRHVSSQVNAFIFKDSLLSFSSVRINNQDVTSSVENWPLGITPVKAIRFVGGSNHWYQFCRGFDPSYVYITGTWGIRADYSSAWVQYDTVQTNPIAPADISFLVSDADGDDPYGIAPRFSPGQLVRIGAGPEIMRTTAVDATLNRVSVVRKQNGTSLPAGNYDAGSAVYVYETEDPIRRVVARQAAMMYARIGAFQVESLDGVVITYPQDLLAELQNTLTNYQYI